MTIERSTRREKRTMLWIAATMLSLLLYAGLAVFSLFQPWAIWAAMAAAAVALGFGAMWAASLDEAAQQAQYVSWYWGGSAGLGFSVLVFLAIMPHMQQPEALASAFGGMQFSAGLGFAAGFLLGIVPLVLGYVISWAVISIRRA